MSVLRIATVTLMGACLSLPAAAQLAFSDSQSSGPLEITAEQGLELQQDARTVIGRGNATASRNGVTVTADTLIAHYRNKSEAPGAKPVAAPPPTPAAKTKDKDGKDPLAGGANGGSGGSEIWRVEAVGHVVIRSATQTATGDRGDYNIDSAVVVLTGSGLKLVGPNDIVTARDSLEYWENKQQAVARGAATAQRGDKKVAADVLVAQFEKDEQGKMDVRRTMAYDHVVLTTLKDKVTGDRGDYNTQSGIATVTGAVKLVRGDNILTGGYAQVNMNTGISTLYPNAPGSSGGDTRVKGLVVPAQKGAAHHE